MPADTQSIAFLIKDSSIPIKVMMPPMHSRVRVRIMKNVSDDLSAVQIGRAHV